MLRDPRHSLQPDICWKNCFKETNSEVIAQREDGSRDLHSQVSPAQACSWLPQFLRGLFEYLYNIGAL